MKGKISYNSADIPKVAFKRKQLSEFISILVEDEGYKLETIHIIFCSDTYLLNINNEFLNHDYYTDIITFDYSQDNSINGELYISYERIKENSLQHKVPLKEELFRVIFHGMLHLSGYKDKSVKDKKIMTGKENFYLTKFKGFVQNVSKV